MKDYLIMLSLILWYIVIISTTVPTWLIGILMKNVRIMYFPKWLEDAIKVFKIKLVLTRKKHECWGCGKINPIKTEMINTTFSYDGRLVSVYHCTEWKQLETHA